MESRDAPTFRDRFGAAAPDYARYRPRYPATLVDWLADQSPATDVAWDAGCGSGQLSTALAHRFGRVIATDASAAQLAQAEPHPGVEYRRALAERSGLDATSVDLAVAAQAAHWFDLPGYYAEVRRVARPGTLVALITYGHVRVGPEVDRLTDAFNARDLAEHWPAERRHVDNAYDGLPFPFETLAPPPFEMSAEWSVEKLLGYVETWSGVRRLEAAEGRGPIDTYRRAVAEKWGPVPVRRVHWPLTVRAGRTRGD